MNVDTSTWYTLGHRHNVDCVLVVQQDNINMKNLKLHEDKINIVIIKL